MFKLQRPTRYSQLSLRAMFLQGNACTFSNSMLPFTGRKYTWLHSLHIGPNQGYAVQYGKTKMHCARGHCWLMNCTNLGIKGSGGWL